MSRAKNPREATISFAATRDTLRKMRIAAAHQDMSLSNYIYNIIKIATRNFTVLHLTDIEQNFKGDDTI